MAYHTPILICGCGETFSLDVRENVDFMRTCTKCGSDFVIRTDIPKHLLADPSRQGSLTNGKTE